MTIKFGFNFIDYTIESYSGQDTTYPATNINVVNHLLRPWHSADTTEHTIVIDLGSSVSVDAIFIDDVNFDDITIEGNDTDSWGTPSFQETGITISFDYEVQRYKIFYEPTSFSYRYIRLVIPSQSVLDNKGYYRIGRVIVPATITTPDYNIQYDYNKVASKPKARNNSPSGTFETVSLGSSLIWRGNVSWGYYPEGSINNFYDINNYLENNLALLFENRGDTSKAWCVEKQGEIETELFNYNAVRSNTIQLKEKV